MDANNPLAALPPWNKGWNFIACRGNDNVIAVLNHLTRLGVTLGHIKLVNKSLHRTDVFYRVD